VSIDFGDLVSALFRPSFALVIMSKLDFVKGSICVTSLTPYT
jgi:hypothetical protein